ncbi:hypothetical protein [Bradyrhizobium sp.]|uniref:hypothetical protein n=1 Tax=Bradyrhizobium sp. TaxID=376 RepID=UPI003C17421E
MIDQLRLEHPFETEKQIIKRYAERLTAERDLMDDAIRGVVELARDLELDESNGEELPPGLRKPH